jgi:pyruvate dehydrogenase E2 component (dihydrolipoamide acetyltransferase)
MQTEVRLPQLELTMEEVRIVSVRIKEGDLVRAEQPLIEVETGKAVLEVPAPRGGFVRRVLVQPEQRIGERALICILSETANETLADGNASGPSSLPQAIPSPTASPPDLAEPLDGPVRAAPAARKLARELGLDLAIIKGSGPAGRITVSDVQAASSVPASAATGDWVPLSASRQALIAQMEKSLREIPQFHLSRKMDVGPLLSKDSGIGFTPRLIHAVAAALKRHPALRTAFAANKVRLLPAHVAVAIDTPETVVAPIIRHADTVSLEQIARSLNDFKVRARSGKFKLEELAEGPFAISNLGMFNVDLFTPFVFHGQTAVLAIGRVAEGRAWFSLAADHRVADGAEAARFLESLQQTIHRP